MEARRRACVVGAILADAATTPMHWVYDQDKLAAAIGDNSPYFFPDPQCPFYKVEPGSISPYGAEYMALAQGLNESKGAFDSSVLVKIFSQYFSKWEGYKNHTVKSFEQNVADSKSYPEVADADDTQAACLVKAPLIAAAFSHTADFEAHALKTIHLTQLHDLPCAVGIVASKLIGHALKGDDVASAISKTMEDAAVDEEVKKAMRDVLDSQNSDAIATGKEWGISCALPAAFKVALLIALQAKSFEEGVAMNIRVGGDNCSRAIFLGGLLAAAGLSPPEQEWCAKVSDWDNMTKTLTSLLTHFD
jgi:ADP-ribosylglycohydrolase